MSERRNPGTFRLIWAAATAATLLLASPAAAQSGAVAPASVQTLRPGDVVKITVWRQPELSGEFRILSNGAIAHPLYQSVNVVGVPITDVAGLVREYLTRLTNDPQVVVEPMLSVAVGGEVRNPGMYNVPAGTSVSQAVALAGGGGDQGSLNGVRLVRGTQRITLDLTNAGISGASMPIQSGDQIFISRRGNSFRDVIGPLASVLAAAAAIITVSRR